LRSEALYGRLRSKADIRPYNPETGTVSEGETLESAVANLREAVVLYLEEFPLPATGAAFVTTVSIPEHA
jgi:hypothetical protein